MDLKVKGICQRMRRVTTGLINNGITFNLITTTLKYICHTEVSKVLFVIVCVYVCVSFCSAVSAPGGNGKQELCGRCLCCRRSSVFLPRQCPCLFEDLLSLLRHIDETANQRACCIPSFIKKTYCRLPPNHKRYTNISYISDKHGSIWNLLH